MSSEVDLQTAFEGFDTDKNGYIDESEFAALVTSLGVNFTAEKLRVAFLAIDVNGNERIEFGEFRSWWTKHHVTR